MKRFTSAKVASAIFAFIIVLLVGNIVYLGATGKHFISGQDIQEYADNRNTKEVIQYAKRGEIYTSDNQVVASNVQKYVLRAVMDETRINASDEPAYVVDIEETAKALAPIIGMDEAEMLTKMVSARDDGLYQIQFGVYGNNLSATVKNEIDELELPGIEFDEVISRNYPLGDFSSYLIGYAQNEEQNGISEIVGKMGVELYYDDILAGKNGYTVYQADSSGYILPNGVLEDVEVQHGQNIHLTIDSTLQRDLDLEIQEMVETADGEFASAAIMDARTGEMLAMSSYPSFDPNVRDVENYTNLFTEYLFEPGSVMKSFVYANAIEDGVYNDNATFPSGTIEVDEATIRDWNNGVGFGTITYEQGLAMSSNVGIASMILNYTNRDSLIEDYNELGFFEPFETDIGTIPGGSAGFYNTNRDLELITAGYGQGMTTTALHVLRGYSAFVNDGKMVTPYFVEKIENPETGEVTYTGTTEYSKQIYSTETVTKVNELLYNNVNGEEHVANSFTMDNGELIGKTGTAQVASQSGGYRTDVFIRSFIGVTTFEGKEVIIYVYMQGPASGNSVQMGELVQTMVTNTLASRSASTNSEDTEFTYNTQSYVNQSVSYAKSMLDSVGANVVIIGNGSSVTGQYPEANVTVSEQNKVFLMTNGTEVELPDFSGWSRKDVTTYCAMISLEVTYSGESSIVESQSIDEGTVVSSDMILEITLE